MHRASLALLAMLWAPAPGLAHDGASHRPSPAEAAPGAEALPFPVDIRPDFDLTDQSGNRVTEADFAGRPIALFFGYANCEAICSVALPTIAEAVTRLGPEGARITPVMITVDPERDTPEALARSLPRYHPRLVGLTGSPEALAQARDAFQVEATEVARDAAGEPIFAHGGFIYLIGEMGEVRSVLPPILGPERVAELMRRHLLVN
ncbi:SCO family protein [Limibaculum sp. M0105]|uniref:SCO family protein n=1 Tax=Thermohalobaculum xanthum TaxID=2753746 RepID=A0A8J7MAJ0_9RHOB|nr:SCO family protein [Thermohalobaculum xanthum]MBK0400494.1 SCO family protein [Thermohalobaculum xanthum]